MKVFLSAILMILTLSGCAGQIFSSESIFAPTPARMGKPDKNAPEEYTKGWDDGCKTGLSTMVHGYYKSFYAYKQDPELANNAMYYKAWKDAYTYCRQYSFRYIWAPMDNTWANGPLCVICPNELR